MVEEYYNRVIQPFAFVNGVTPLSDWNVLLVPPVYFTLIWATKKFVAARKTPFDLNWVG
jgi:hypothetical protein